MIPLDTTLHSFTKALLLLLFLYCAPLTYAQSDGEDSKKETENSFKGATYDKVRTRFNKPEIEIKKTGLISNVIKVINNSNENLNFTLDVLLPKGWTNIVGNDKVYNVSIKDTIPIPVLLIPSKLKKNNSEVMVNCFLIDLEGQQIGDNSFVIKTTKKVAWEVEVKTANRFYFKNEEYNKKFEYTVTNRGNYKQDIYVDHVIPKNDLYLTDTSDVAKKLKRTDNLLSLEIGEQADFSYSASAIIEDKRNQRRVSNTGYNPYSSTEYKKYGLLINSSEPKRMSTKYHKKSNKVAFIKLPNEIELQSYGYPSLPLTVELNVQNLMSDYPFMNLNMRGVKVLKNNANLVYSTQLNYYKAYYDKNQLKDSPWYIGYFSERTSFEIGQVGSGIMGIPSFGTGMRASLRFNDSNKISAFYSSSESIFNEPESQSFGGSYTISFFRRLQIKGQIGRSENQFTNKNLNIINIQPTLYIGRRNRINLMAAQSQQEIGGAKDVVGYRFGGGFSLNLFKNQTTTVNGNYNDKNFGGGSSERLGLSQRTSVRLNRDWTTYLNNSYNYTLTPLLIDGQMTEYLDEVSFNNLLFSHTANGQSNMYGIYYDIRNNLNTNLINRGVSYRNSFFIYEKNLQNSITVRGGYAKLVDDGPTRDHFRFDFTSLTRYKVWTFTTRYRYGIQNINSRQNTGYNAIPQFLRLSAQNQYVFKNKKLILETNVNYNYLNTTKNNSFGLFPQLFYYTKGGWRFNLKCNYSYRSTDYSDIYTFNQDVNFSVNRTGKNTNSFFNVGFGIRKEFGIPIPFAKPNSSNIEFVTFFDVNGNGIKEDDENALQNVVINLDGKEVLTNYNGVAKMNKVAHEKYPLSVFPLEELQGWFPNLNDTITVTQNKKHYIPFVRGVKIQGDVIVDLQKIAVADDKMMDLSNIKITATKDISYNTLTDVNGHFEFYLPNGKYILNMDESILASNLRLSRNNIPIVLKNTQESVYVSFYILEKRRKVILRDFSKKKKKQ